MRRTRRLRACALTLLLLVLLPLSDTSLGDPKSEYDAARKQLLHGHFEESQWEAEVGFRRFNKPAPYWATKFELLQAESMIWRGLHEPALRILENPNLKFRDPNDEILRLGLEAVALIHLHHFALADQKLTQTEHLCAANDYVACGGILRARGILAIERGNLDEAQHFLLASLAFARAHKDQPLETTALLNLGVVSLQKEHYDESVDWLTSAYRMSLQSGDDNGMQSAIGNLGWAYFGLGDREKALGLFLDARSRAAALGVIRSELQWLTTIANVYQENGDLAQATDSYQQAIALAKQIHSVDVIVNALEDLAYISIEAGKLSDAETYIEEARPLIRASGNEVDALDVMLAQGEIASARNQDQQAEMIFRAVERDPSSQASMKLDAEHQLALLYERQRNTSAADRMYRTALTSFESAREQLKNEDSKIPYATNATNIYDDYIRLLVSQRKTDEALRIADESRAQTLEQGLGLSDYSSDIPNLNPTEIARKTNATLLFYWLGNKQSYLWEINPRKIALFPLPPQRQIAQSIEHYRRSLLGIDDPAENSDSDGLALYRMLVAPAASSLIPGSNVILLNDGALSLLNFETLIVPTPHPHYWIEDAAVVSAPSLHLLAAAHPARPTHDKLLLIGDAVSPNIDYPELPEAAAEMKRIQEEVGTQRESIYSREKATTAAYLNSNPQRFTYIHFVAHGVASRTDPLDSAIILSRATQAEDSFKLHAREIIQHPINARLVTIAACYGSGSRSYAGEGPVGLAWAFLHAGAHNVIGALWEVSDESTPKLMGMLYRELERGLPPGEALRNAKLSLLHSQTQFRKPFYWAPFQIYTGR